MGGELTGRPGATHPCGCPSPLTASRAARGAIMLIPSYTAAALTGEMVWTNPTLAGASALAASLKRPEDPTRAVDEGDTDDASSEDDPDGGGDTESGRVQLVSSSTGRRRGLAADGRAGSSVRTQ